MCELAGRVGTLLSIALSTAPQTSHPSRVAVVCVPGIFSRYRLSSEDMLPGQSSALRYMRPGLFSNGLVGDFRVSEY